MGKILSGTRGSATVTPSLRSSSIVNTYVDPVNVTKPAGTVQNDFLFCIQAAGAAPTVPTGFTALVNSTDGDGFCFALSYKVAGGSEPSSYECSNGVFSYAAILCYKDINPTTPFESYSGANFTNTATPTAPSSTASLANSLRLMLWRCGDTANETVSTPPSSATEDLLSYTQAGFSSALNAVYSQEVGAGATGTKSITLGHTEWGYSASLILKPV